MKKEKIDILDTTLRDGQQCPGAGLSVEKNLEYAELACQIGIDVLEAGFPSASQTDFNIVYHITEVVLEKSSRIIISALCQLRRDQVEKTIECLSSTVKTKRGRLHVYVPVDPELMRASLGDRFNDYAGIKRDVHEFCKLAFMTGLEVEFSPEGYSRMNENFDFVTDLIRAAIEGGASVINCPDTIGGACWLQGKDYFVNHLKQHAEIIRGEYPNKNIIWSTHCHNDFGLALNNSLEAVYNGPARQIEGCFNGIGERAGNVSLEQCIMIIKHFSQNGDGEFFTDVDTTHLKKISDFVSEWMLVRQPHSPIIGENSARHSSGGHTNAVLKNPLAYQPFDPAEVGSEISLVFGPLSGGNHAKDIIDKAGYKVSDDEKGEIAQYIKNIYHTRRKGITDYEVLEGYFEFKKPIKIESFDYGKRSTLSEIFLKGQFFNQSGEIRDVSEGRDSALATLKKAIDRCYPGLQILSYYSESSGSGISATSISTIVVTNENGENFTGKGEDYDIEISAMKALIDGVNRAYVDQHYKVKK